MATTVTYSCDICGREFKFESALWHMDIPSGWLPNITDMMPKDSAGYAQLRPTDVCSPRCAKKIIDRVVRYYYEEE